VVQEVRRQFREIAGLMEGTTPPDSARCVDITTKAALREMLVPGLTAVFVPFFVGTFLGTRALGGLLAGTTVCGALLALMMANAGGAWDNAKKVVEVDLKAKGTELHAATVVGDTVGDPFKDTSSVALNPIIKFTTLFGVLAVEMEVVNPGVVRYAGVALFLVAVAFVYRSFYGMRITSQKIAEATRTKAAA